MTNAAGLPGDDEIELILLGPGYGESIVLHIGGGTWVVVDSCADPDGTPRALSYLESIGVDPARSVALIVATHWHDDHIRGIARLVEACPDARFCCASAFCSNEFLALVGTLEGQHFSAAGSGLREIHDVFSRLGNVRKPPTHAVANRLVFQKDGCKIWSLSPGDGVFQRFLKSVGSLVPRQGENKIRIPSLSPNEVAVALWVECGGGSLLLGADLERRGWSAILGDSMRPAGKASVFKVSHHGSANADEPAVWKQMLHDEPVAVLTPWRRGSRALPTMADVKRISCAAPNSWITATDKTGHARVRYENKMVERTLRESGVRIRRLAGSAGMIRLRWRIGSDDEWKVETFGNAGRLLDYTV